MRTFVLASLIAGLLVSTAAAQPFVRLDTAQGEILLVLLPELAPNHVANFVHLSRTGFYDGTAFHRVIPGFMIQGGDPNSKDADRADDGQGGPAWDDVLTAEEQALVEQVRVLLEGKGYGGLTGRAELRAEFNDGHHDRGTLSMARAQSPDSAGSQFFITVADTPHLDGKYTVFGKVVAGMETVDAIVGAPRDRGDNPLESIRVRSATVLDAESDLTDGERAAWAAYNAPAASATAE
jgi:peptidyl-prolyl cis-trans isomerase B (cyclophilin B)